MMMKWWTEGSSVGTGLGRKPETGLIDLWEETRDRSIIGRRWLDIRALNDLRLDDGWLNILWLAISSWRGEWLLILNSNSWVGCWGGASDVRSYRLTKINAS